MARKEVLDPPADWNDWDEKSDVSQSKRKVLEAPVEPDNFTKEEAREAIIKVMESKKEKSDGSSAGYYDFPERGGTLQNLISYRNMNAQIGEIFRLCYIFGKGELEYMAPMDLPLPDDAEMLQDLISFLNLNAQLGEVFRACFRMGHVEHSEESRDARKIKFYLDAELERIKKYDKTDEVGKRHAEQMIQRINAEIIRLGKYIH